MLCTGDDVRTDRSLGSWLKACSGIVFRDEIIDLYSGIRWQTRIDRETGAPARETLRATRVLRQGLRFSSAIHLQEDRLTPEAKYALALTAAGLQSMGSSRSRGLGVVKCRLMDGERDLTAEAIAKLEQQPIQEPALRRRTPRAANSAAAGQSGVSPTSAHRV